MGAAALCCFAVVSCLARDEVYPRRWFMAPHAFETDADMAYYEKLFAMAGKAGFNGAILRGDLAGYHSAWADQYNLIPEVCELLHKAARERSANWSEDRTGGM